MKVYLGLVFTGFILFKINFKLFSANGVSRRTLFCSLVIVMGISAATMSLIITLNTILLSHFTKYLSSFAQLYYGSILSDSQSTHYTVQMLAQQFVWQGFGYFWIAMLGLLITVLYYRMNRGMKIAVSIGVPVFCICVFPILDFALWDFKLTHAMQTFFSFALGFSNGSNLYIGMISMVIFAAIAATLAWLLVRRANVKQ